MTGELWIVAYESGCYSEYAAMVDGRAFPTRDAAVAYLADNGFREVMATPHLYELDPGRGVGDAEVPRMAVTDRRDAERFAKTVPEDRRFMANEWGDPVAMGDWLCARVLPVEVSEPDGEDS